ncbi:WAT1-related protein [Drosera capensis]
MWEELKMGAILTTMELMDVVANTLIKAAKTNDNFSNLVFIFYSHALGSLPLLPSFSTVIFYKGMPINLQSPSKSPHGLQASLSASDWVIGRVFLALSYLLIALLSILKAIMAVEVVNTVQCWAFHKKGACLRSRVQATSDDICSGLGGRVSQGHSPSWKDKTIIRLYVVNNCTIITSSPETLKPKRRMAPAMAEIAAPYVGMIMAECAQVGLIILSKQALSSGMSSFVFVTYSHALVALIFGYVGINYSSPTLGTVMLNLVPGFTFLLAIFFRMEKLDWKSFIFVAKSAGTIISVAGALVVTLYQGPPLLRASSAHSHHLNHLKQNSKWVLGGLFLAIDCVMASGWLILQAPILRKYPAELIVVFFYCFFVAIQCGIVTLFLERDTSAWSLKPKLRLISILYSAVFGSAFQVGVSSWCLQRKGPVFVSMFKPVGIAIAVAFGVIFLDYTFYLGRHDSNSIDYGSANLLSCIEMVLISIILILFLTIMQFDWYLHNCCWILLCDVGKGQKKRRQIGSWCMADRKKYVWRIVHFLLDVVLGCYHLCMEVVHIVEAIVLIGFVQKFQGLLIKLQNTAHCNSSATVALKLASLMCKNL